MKDFDKKFTRLLLKMMSEGERITPAQAKKLQGRLSRADTPEKKKALLTELQQASAPKSKSRAKSRAKSPAKSPAKAQKTKEVVKVISEVQAEATSRVRAVEEELAILSTLPGSNLPKIEALREIANELKIDISDLGRKKKEMLLRLHAQSGGRLKKFDRLVSRIEAEKKEPNIKNPKTDIGYEDFLKGRYFQKYLLRHGVSVGDRLSPYQYDQLQTAWARHLNARHDIEDERQALSLGDLYVCRLFDCKAEKKEPKIKNPKHEIKNPKPEIKNPKTEIKNPKTDIGYEDFLKGSYLKKEMKEDNLSFGDTLDDFQWKFMGDAWAEHLMTKHNINKDFAYYLSGRYLCRVFNYKLCRMIKIQDSMR
jgi:hypothetical protein